MLIKVRNNLHNWIMKINQNKLINNEDTVFDIGSI